MRHVFGVSGLRFGQQAVIDAVLAKQHTLAIMPTGAGKSLCSVLLEALGETVEWSHCRTCDNCSGLSIRSEAVAVGAA
jgi:ATP-dependent DNA helicase RecQ